MFKRFLSQWKLPLAIGGVSVPAFYLIRPYITESGQSLSKIEEELQQSLEKYNENDQKISDLYVKLANLYQQKDQTEKALENYKKANAIFTNYGYAGIIPEGDFYKQFAESLSKSGEIKEAARYIEKSFDSNSKAENTLETLNSLIDGYFNLGSAYKHLDELDSAIRCYTKALNIENTLPEKDQKSLVRLLVNLGDALYTKGEPELLKSELNEAISLYKKALDKVDTDQGANSLAAATVLAQIAKTNYALKKLDQSTYFCNKSLGIYRDNLQIENPDYASCSILIGNDLMYQRKDVEALSHFQQGVSIYEKLNKSPQDEENEAKALVNSGVISMRLKKYSEAVDLTQRGFDKFVEVKGKEHMETLEAGFNLALIQAQTGNKLEALRRAQEIYIISKERLVEGSELTKSCLQLLTQLTS